MVKLFVIGICGNSVFLQVEHFHQKGETLAATGCFEEVGGKGINQAIAAARMGAQVTFLAAVGNDRDGEKCMQTAKDTGLLDCFAVKKGQRTTFAFILTDKHAENRVTVCKGAELCPADVLAVESRIAESDILLLQNEVPADVNEAAVGIARKHGVRVILNPAPIRDISDAIAGGVSIVPPNEQERGAIDPSRFDTVITTLGKQGCDLNGDTVIPGLAVKAVDTTGAGDTFNGVLAVCVAEGMELEKACRYAVTASGLSVTKPCVLNAIPKRRDIERRMHNE